MSKNRIFGLVTGQSGTGKSYLVKKYLIPELAKEKPVFVFDLLNEYQDIADYYYNDFIDFINQVSESGLLMPGVHVMAWKTDETIINAIHFFRRLEKPVSLVFEEMHSLFNDPDLKREVGKPLKEMTFYGRHHNVDFIMITQRPRSLSTDLRSQIPFVLSFRQTLSTDVDCLEEIDKKAGSKVVDLDDFYFYAFGEIPDKLKKIKKEKVQKL